MIVHAAAVDLAKSFVQKLNAAIFFPLITLMTVVAVIFFLYGCFEYVAGASNPQAKEKGKKHILWGLIGLLIMLSAYTILSIAAATFGVDVEEAVSPFAPLEAPVPGARPEGAVLPDGSTPTSPLPTPRPEAADCRQFGLHGCGPAPLDNPYSALREEYNYTGGAALGSSNLMSIQSIPEGGNLQRGIDAADELLRYEHITPETHERVVNQMIGDATEYRLSNP